jgi:hypothetical protein
MQGANIKKSYFSYFSYTFSYFPLKWLMNNMKTL